MLFWVAIVEKKFTFAEGDFQSVPRVVICVSTIPEVCFLMDICCGWSHNSVWALRTKVFPTGVENPGSIHKIPTDPSHVGNYQKSRFFAIRSVLCTAWPSQSIPNHRPIISKCSVQEKVVPRSSLALPASKNWKFWRFWTPADIHQIPTKCEQFIEKPHFGRQEPF